MKVEWRSRHGALTRLWGINPCRFFTADDLTGKKHIYLKTAPTVVLEFIQGSEADCIVRPQGGQRKYINVQYINVTLAIGLKMDDEDLAIEEIEGASDEGE